MDGRAHVVNIASIGGAIVFTPAAPYSASKHAQVAFSRSLRAALRGSGIEVHTILPGFVTTPGFPHPKVFATRLGRLVRRRPRARREGHPLGGGARPGRGRDPLVPLQARRDRPGRRADADRPGAARRGVRRRGMRRTQGAGAHPPRCGPAPLRGEAAALARDVPADLDLVDGAGRHAATRRRSSPSRPTRSR